MNTVNMVEGAIPFIGGLGVALYAFGLGNTPEMRKWRERYGRPMKLVGPLTMVFGVARALGAL